MKVSYLQKNGLRVVPKSGGFDVVFEETNRLAIHTKTLYEAEDFIISKDKKEVDKMMFESAAEVRTY